MSAPALPAAPAPAAPVLDETDVERRGLTIFLRQARAFRLALTLYNDPVARDESIRSLRRELAEQSVRVLTLDLREPAPEHTLLGRVEAIVKGADAKPGERLAVMVVNLEGQVDYTPELAQRGGPGTAFLETANLHRELFPDACPGPLIIWMTELLERAFVQHAPDLWHWRSHVFDLRAHFAATRNGTSLVCAVWPDVDFRGVTEQRVRQLIEELAAHRRVVSSFDESRILNALGLAYLADGSLQSAHENFEKSLAIARRSGSKHAQGTALYHLGNTSAAMGEWPDAMKFYEQALAIAHEALDVRREGEVLQSLAKSYAALGELLKAREAYEQAAGMLGKADDQRIKVSLTLNLSSSYLASGEWYQTIELCQQSLAIFRSLSDRKGESKALNNLGIAYVALGEMYKAIECYEKIIANSRELDDSYGEVIGLWNKAGAFWSVGDRSASIKCIKEALIILKMIDNPGLVYVHMYLWKWLQEPG